MNNTNDKTNKTSKSTPLPKFPQRQKIQSKKTERRNNKRGVIGILVALLIIAATVFAVVKITTRAPDCYELSYGTVTMRGTSKAVLIKDEVGYSYPDGITLLWRVPDGTYVETGDEVARVRTSEFENDWCEQLRIARRNTIEYMLKHIPNQDDVLLSAIDVIDTEIETVSDEMLHVLSYMPEKYGEYSEKLEELYHSKETLLLSKMGSDQYISDYIRSEESLKAKIDNTTQSIYALRSGIVSYNTDGYANVYNAENVDEVTEVTLDNIIENKYTTSIRNTRMAVDYTISDMSTCYIVLNGDTSLYGYLRKHDEVVINLNNGMDNYYSTISEITELVDGYLVKIKLVGDFDKLYRTRFIDVSVNKSWNGIVIPKEHLKKNKDELGVYVYEDGKQTFVPVLTLAENDDVIVVDTSSPDCKLKKGLLIVKK